MGWISLWDCWRADTFAYDWSSFTSYHSYVQSQFSCVTSKHQFHITLLPEPSLLLIILQIALLYVLQLRFVSFQSDPCTIVNNWGCSIFWSAEHVVMISVAFLIILFSVQRYGTSKVGLVVGPALFVWFCSLAGIGIYNLVKYDTSVLRAFNPIHIYYFFKRNSTKAWYSLGGCLLCATGRLWRYISPFVPLCHVCALY